MRAETIIPRGAAEQFVERQYAQDQRIALIEVEIPAFHFIGETVAGFFHVYTHAGAVQRRMQGGLEDRQGLAQLVPADGGKMEIVVIHLGRAFWITACTTRRPAPRQAARSGRTG